MLGPLKHGQFSAMQVLGDFPKARVAGACKIPDNTIDHRPFQLPRGGETMGAGDENIFFSIATNRDRRLQSDGGAPAASGETAAALSIRRPKKRGPFQDVAVIARAMMERLA